MTGIEKEFTELLQRYKAMKQYERTRLATDTPENVELAYQRARMLIHKLNQVWERLDEETKQKYSQEV